MRLSKKPAQFSSSNRKSLLPTVTCLILLVKFSSLQAQVLSLTTGPSIPTGLYASKDVFVKDAGFAAIGIHFSAIFDDQRRGRLVNPFVQYTYNSNQIDHNAIERIYKFSDPNFMSIQITQPYRQNFLIAGGRVNYFNQKYDLFAKAGVGLAWMSTVAWVEYYDSTRVLKRKSSSVNAICLTAGFGMNLHLNPLLAITAGVDYYYAKANYGKVKFTDPNGNVVLTSANEDKVPFQSFSPYIGLRFYLRKVYPK